MGERDWRETERERERDGRERGERQRETRERHGREREERDAHTRGRERRETERDRARYFNDIVSPAMPREILETLYHRKTLS